MADTSAGLASLRRRSVDLEIVIPALNERHRLAPTLEKTVRFLGDRPWSSAIVVVDNGSVDGTSQVVLDFQDVALPVYLIGCSRIGKGAAVRRGFMTSNARYLGFMDADLATHLEALDIAMTLLSEGHPAVIGSRYLEGARIGTPEKPVRRLGGRVFRAVAGRVVQSVADTQCGFKFFRGDLVRQFTESCSVDGFAFDVELLSRLQAAGYGVTEIPVAWDWDEGSTFNIARDGISTFLDVIRLGYKLGPVGHRSGRL